jgi:RNA polymerase sigma-70 factor (ECF subfamily)
MLRSKQLDQALDRFQAALAIDGDKRAFTLLYTRWHPRFLRFACRLSGNAEEGRDIVQEAAVTIASNIHKLKDPARFSAWAYTIIRRRTFDHIDANMRRRDLQAKLSVRAENIDIKTESEISQLTSLSLKQALSRLDKSDRLLLTLFYLDGLTGAEMAAAMGLPPGTIKSRLFTARKKLKSHMQITPEKGEKNE